MELIHSCLDSHCHVFRADLPMTPQRRYTPKYNALPEQLGELLREHGLQGALLIQPSFLGTDNSYLLDTLSTYAQHETLSFKGVVVLDPTTIPDRQTLADMDDSGVIGIRLNLFGQASLFDYTIWKPLLTEAEVRGWHIELHCEASKLAHILPVLVRNHAKIVLDHLGLVTDIKNCTGLKTILDQPAERLWIKKSATYRLNFPGNELELKKHVSQLTRLYRDHIGEDRILWGSDWPFTQHEHIISYKEMVDFRKSDKPL